MILLLNSPKEVSPLSLRKAMGISWSLDNPVIHSLKVTIRVSGLVVSSFQLFEFIKLWVTNWRDLSKDDPNNWLRAGRSRQWAIISVEGFESRGQEFWQNERFVERFTCARLNDFRQQFSYLIKDRISDHIRPEEGSQDQETIRLTGGLSKSSIFGVEMDFVHLESFFGSMDGVFGSVSIILNVPKNVQWV